MSGMSNPYISASHVHSIAPPSLDSNGLRATGSISNGSLSQVGAAGTCGAVGCDAQHPANVVAQVTNAVLGSGAAKTTYVTGIPAVTGAPQ